MKDIMIDIETLGTRYNAAIIQIGACYFNRDTGEVGATFEATIKYDAEMMDKFTVDHGTIAWWFGQSPEARASVVKDPISLVHAIDKLTAFITYGGEDTTIWSHATFDMPILVNAFSTVGKRFPLSFRNMRDIRTVMDLSKHYSEAERKGAHHEAVSDAVFQATYVSEAIYKLKGDGKSE